jgi:predicted Zn-dependent protease
MAESDKWKVLLEEDPNDELLLFTYAKALYDEKKWSSAALVFQKLVTQKPDYALAWAFLARALLESGDRAGAEQACQAGLPVARKQCHEIPLEAIESVLEDLKSDF